MVVLVIGGIWCAFSQSLGSHIAGRDVMSLAAGQSEALAPMIHQEIFFLHESGRKLSWFIFIENIGTGVFFIVSTYMTAAWGWRWCKSLLLNKAMEYVVDMRAGYGFFAIMNGALLVISFVFVSETFYEKRDDAVSE
jgi:MFS family permease